METGEARVIHINKTMLTILKLIDRESFVLEYEPLNLSINEPNLINVSILDFSLFSHLTSTNVIVTLIIL